MFFHDRQIEQNLIECVQTIHIDDSHHTPSAHTFPDVDDHARLLCAQGCFGSRAQLEKKSFCDMDAGYSMWKTAVEGMRARYPPALHQTLAALSQTRLTKVALLSQRPRATPD